MFAIGITKRFKFIVVIFFITINIYSQHIDLFHEINEYRISLGLTPVLLSTTSLLLTSLEYSEKLSERGELSHLDTDGGRAWERAYRNGHNGVRVGEVLGYQSSEKDSNNMVQLWINSPDHNAILTNPDWNSMAFSVSSYNNKSIYVCLFSTSVIEEYYLIEDIFNLILIEDKNIYIKINSSDIEEYYEPIVLDKSLNLVELYQFHNSEYIRTDRLIVRRPH